MAGETPKTRLPSVKELLILQRIADAETPPSGMDLVRATGDPIPTVFWRIDQLERGGYVEKGGKGKKRAAMPDRLKLQVTEAGKAVLAMVRVKKRGKK